MGLAAWLPRFITTSEIKGICENFRQKYCKGAAFPLDIELIVEKKLDLHVIPIAGIRSLIGIDAFLRSDFSGIVVDNQEYLAYSALEWQANQFAGNILVPREDLSDSLRKALNAAKRDSLTSRLKNDPGQMLALIAPSISRMFGVSEKVIERRVKDENLWPD